jgi:EAL domain-containing protein (putative c-di-GMP-specific phosphodiesterase class I)
VGPDDFLAVAESFGLMPRIDEWVLNHALALVGQHPGGRRLAEIEAQRAVLAELGVGFLQGYGIARPMPLADYLEGLGKPASPTSDGPDLPRPPA